MRRINAGARTFQSVVQTREQDAPATLGTRPFARSAPNSRIRAFPHSPNILKFMISNPDE